MNEPVDLSSPDQGRNVLVQRAVILGTCTLVTILYAMTVTIANVSLPQMQGALSVTQDQITWVVTFILLPPRSPHLCQVGWWAVLDVGVF